jgi:hypothetical protein
LAPSGSIGDDFVCVGGPDEGLWPLVVIDDEAVDGSLQIDDVLEDSAFEATLGEHGEEALDGVEPAESVVGAKVRWLRWMPRSRHDST